MTQCARAGNCNLNHFFKTVFCNAPYIRLSTSKSVLRPLNAGAHRRLSQIRCRINTSSRVISLLPHLPPHVPPRLTLTHASLSPFLKARNMDPIQRRDRLPHADHHRTARPNHRRARAPQGLATICTRSTLRSRGLRRRGSSGDWTGEVSLGFLRGSVGVSSPQRLNPNSWYLARASRVVMLVLVVEVRVVIRAYTCSLGFISPHADHFRAVARTVENNCPVRPSPGYGFVKIERYKLPTGTKHYDRDRDLRASPLKPASRYSTNYDIRKESATATATRDVPADRDPPTPSNKRKREDKEDREDAYVGYGYQQSKRTNKGAGGGDTSFSRVHTNSSIKTSQPSLHPLPRFILLPPPSPSSFNLTSGRPPPASTPSATPAHLEDNKTPHTMHLDAHYQLPSLPFHAYRLDLSTVQPELVRTVQMRLVKTGWMLREEREERRRLERLVDAQTRVVPPTSGSSMMSMSMSISGGSSGEGSGSMLMDYEEDDCEAGNTHMWDGPAKKEADADAAEHNLVCRSSLTIPDDGSRYDTLRYENEKLRAEASETSSPPNAPPVQPRRIATITRDERLLQQQWNSSYDFGYNFGVKGISPASVPAIMEAFVRLAQLTDKVMLDVA
ncbi:hypothetical protein BC629DRAFT_1727118 [Irpex lacteus]|nr:hypothetical protein BC629DRAFT_1727118 [Irpex lacteus]